MSAFMCLTFKALNFELLPVSWSICSFLKKHIVGFEVLTMLMLIFHFSTVYIFARHNNLLIEQEVTVVNYLCWCNNVATDDNVNMALTGQQSGWRDLDLTVGLVGLEGRCRTRVTGEGFWTLCTWAGTGTVASIVRILLFIHCYQLERERKTCHCVLV